MRGLKLTVFVLSFLALTSQLLRHTYERWIVRRTSVIDKYATPSTSTARDATSLEDLERRYAIELERARKDVAAFRAGAPQANAVPAYAYPRSEENDPEVMRLMMAIRQWETQENEIRALFFYWACGAVILVLATAAHRRRWAWAAVVLQILAFAEMIYWTSPTFAGPQRELERLLNYKIVFTAISLSALLVAWTAGMLRPDVSSAQVD